VQPPPGLNARPSECVNRAGGFKTVTVSHADGSPFVLHKHDWEVQVVIKRQCVFDVHDHGMEVLLSIVRESFAPLAAWCADEHNQPLAADAARFDPKEEAIAKRHFLYTVEPRMACDLGEYVNVRQLCFT